MAVSITAVRHMTDTVMLGARITTASESAHITDASSHSTYHRCFESYRLLEQCICNGQNNLLRKLYAQFTLINTVHEDYIFLMGSLST